MFFLLLGGILYFLPSILGHDKRSFPAILLLNLFLGWTIIGWVIALAWAAGSEPRVPVYVLAGAARYCPRCGAPAASPAHFCWSCGSRL